MRDLAREEQKREESQGDPGTSQTQGVAQGINQSAGRKNRGLKYEVLMTKIKEEKFSDGQMSPLRLRLDLLGSFMRSTEGTNVATPAPKSNKVNNAGKFVKQKKLNSLEKLSKKEEEIVSDTWEFKPGSLTIVDLSCPFVDENAACALFVICLQLFLDKRHDVGRIVALDEAHKVGNLDQKIGALTFLAYVFNSFWPILLGPLL